MKRGRVSSCYWVLGALALALSAEFAVADDGEATAPEEASKPVEKDDFDYSNEDWGSYYDPQNVFCGKYDCYKILGFDYESFGSVKPDTKMITKRYRKLSREWHPDKSKHKNAKERFVKIARAYEVLTKGDVRQEYDFLRYNQEAYFAKYGTSVLWSYAPKTDTSMVITFLFIIGNIASWYIQKHRWQMVADRLIKAAVEDWSTSQGGSAESKHLREEALAILAEKESEEKNGSAAQDSSATSQKSGKKSSKGKQKVSMKEKKQKEQDLLLPIVTELVNEMTNFGGGFHQPSWRDLMIISLLKLPFKIMSGTFWQMKYWVRRLQKKELNDEEKNVLTEHAVGPVSWDIASDEERQEMVQRELWVKKNLLDWKEEQEIKTLSAADQKYYNKLKKKGKLE